MAAARAVRAAHPLATTGRRTAAGAFRIALIPGDGIGKEVVPATRRVLDAAGAPFEYVDLEAGFELFQRTGVALPEKTLHTLKQCTGSVFGAVSSPSHKVEGYSSPIVKMRKELDLYANVRPVVGGATASRKAIDMVIFRENTECLYVKQEKLERDANGLQRATAVRVITEYASKRIAQAAFEMAVLRAAVLGRRGRVTIVHKANVLSVTDGLFRQCALDVAKSAAFADIIVEEQLVDSMVYKMYREPEHFDVVVAPNMYGDIISDGAAALVGSLGVVPSANVGDSHVMAEPVHGSAPDIVGKGIANPVACIRSGAMLLEYLGEPDEAQRIHRAVDRTLQEGFTTPDLGGAATTASVTDKIIAYL